MEKKKKSDEEAKKKQRNGLTVEKLFCSQWEGGHFHQLSNSAPIDQPYHTFFKLTNHIESEF
jgi:hypothetical protein